jgi:hypothetical protein
MRVRASHTAQDGPIIQGGFGFVESSGRAVAGRWAVSMATRISRLRLALWGEGLASLKGFLNRPLLRLGICGVMHDPRQKENQVIRPEKSEAGRESQTKGAARSRIDRSRDKRARNWDIDGVARTVRRVLVESQPWGRSPGAWTKGRAPLRQHHRTCRRQQDLVRPVAG